MDRVDQNQQGRGDPERAVRENAVEPKVWPFLPFHMPAGSWTEPPKTKLEDMSFHPSFTFPSPHPKRRSHAANNSKHKYNEFRLLDIRLPQ
ncbi:MAG: hypothetical protein M0Z41_09430 [Peptococcaceae bacterium]|nr:hypothetical protein [Peptococcaceae bacterium]